MTCIAALRHDRIDAPSPAIPQCFASREPWQAPPWVIDGPVNAEIFLRYVETQLAPTLGKGDIVIMDNLSSHKGPAVRTANPRDRGKTALSARLQSGPQSDRTTLRQAEAPAAQSVRPNRRGDLEAGRYPPRRVHRKGMQKLPLELRLWFNLTTSCSSDYATLLNPFFTRSSARFGTKIILRQALLLTAKRDFDAVKRFFRKMLKDGPLLSPDRIGTDEACTSQFKKA